MIELKLVCHSCGYERIISEREFIEDLQRCPKCASDTIEIVETGDLPSEKVIIPADREQNIKRRFRIIGVIGIIFVLFGIGLYLIPRGYILFPLTIALWIIGALLIIIAVEIVPGQWRYVQRRVIRPTPHLQSIHMGTKAVHRPRTDGKQNMRPRQRLRAPVSGIHRFLSRYNANGGRKNEMSDPMRVVDIELSQPIRTIHGFTYYTKLRGLVRLFGRPIGYVTVPVEHTSCCGTAIRNTVLEKLSGHLLRAYLELALMTPAGPDRLKIKNILKIVPHIINEKLPLVTVAVCTHNRTSDLKLCLESIERLDYPALDVLVVDNAPPINSTKELLTTSYPHFRYVCEPRCGLDRARNLAITEALGEIIAFTDDDTVVDPGWIRALVAVFRDAPDVMCVTGLVVPFELETDAQRLFEVYGGFGRGFRRRWYHSNGLYNVARHHIGAGKFGTGANMAFRRKVFNSIGEFDPALDVGTMTRGGGDLEMFFRVLKEGHTLVYEPRAVVRHRHRREYPDLRAQIEGWGIAFQSYLVRTAKAYPEERSTVLCIGTIQHWLGILQRFLGTFTRSRRIPRDLISAQLFGSFMGLRSYQAALRDLAPDSDVPVFPDRPTIKTSKKSPANTSAVRIVDLDQPIQPIDDLEVYRSVFVYAQRSGELVGRAHIRNFGRSISALRLCDSLISQIGLRLFDIEQGTRLARRIALVGAYIFDRIWCLLSRIF